MVGDDDGTDDLAEYFVALGKCLQVWANATEATKLDAIFAIRHLLQFGVDAINAKHGLKEGASGFEKLPKS